MSVFQPEEQQRRIYLLKLGLQDIEKVLVVQSSELPGLDDENEEKYHESMSTLRVARSLNAEVERLKLENVKKTAAKIQLKKKSNDLVNNLEQVRSIRNELTASLKQEEEDIKIHIAKYEEIMKEKADIYRKNVKYYNEDAVKAENFELLKSISELEQSSLMQQNVVDGLMKQLHGSRPTVPDNLLSIFGKPQQDKKIKELDKKLKALKEKNAN